MADAVAARRARRRWLLVIIGAVVLVGILLSALSGFYVDLLWFREVHFSAVFWKVFWAKVLMGVTFGLVFFALLAANLAVVRRLTPRFRPLSPEQEVIERYRAAIDPYARWLIIGFSAFIALFVGISAASKWQTLLLWRSAGADSLFGLQDPLFHRDPSFYIFILPFHKYVQNWLFSSLVGITVLVALAHYANGGIRLQTVGEKITPEVKAHLSVLFGLIVLVKAWGYWLGRYDLLVSERGVVTGASYTDVKAQLPALTALMVIAVIGAILFFINIRMRGWIFPVLGIGLLALTSIVIGAIVPAIVQKFQVSPQELQRETPFIERNIDATRFAFSIDLTTEPVNPAQDLMASDIAANDLTISNIRLWKPSILKQTYQALQRIQPYYEFQDVDVDRYPINGQPRMVMLSAREVTQSGIPGAAGWQQTHLLYTHGYGPVASQVNTADESGAPQYLLKDIPPVGTAIQLDATPPNDVGAQIYYGETADVPYVIAGTGQDEVNFPNPEGGGFVSTRYHGEGGIKLGGFFRRLLFAYRYRDINLLISGLINGESKILINRDIGTRVTKAAPFLKYDGDPYAAIVDGRVKFIWDAYTTTDVYPYADRVDLAAATNGDLAGRANYIRNSVKAVVDAYDGTVEFYVVDPTDPLIRVWRSAFPDLFKDIDQASPDLVAHFRYPEDMMQVQAFQFGQYHVTDVPSFFGNTRRWVLPAALPEQVGAAAQGIQRPYYVLFKLPGETQEQFVLFEPLTPAQRPNMVAYMVAGSDPGHYGELKAFEFPSGENIDGPQQVRSLINNDPTVSQQITLLSQAGSALLFGDLVIVPVENGFLYVQPLFVTASAGQVQIPELKRVVVVHGGRVSIANSLQAALALSFGEQPPPSGGGGPPPPTGTAAELIASALTHFQNAQQALTRGDLATYQTEINAAQQDIQRAQQLLAEGGGGTTPSPSASPTPTASPSG